MRRGAVVQGAHNARSEEKCSAYSDYVGFRAFGVFDCCRGQRFLDHGILAYATATLADCAAT